MALGYIASFSETLALAIIVSKGVQPLMIALMGEKDDHIRAACAWSLGQVSEHILVELRVRVLVHDGF